MTNKLAPNGDIDEVAVCYLCLDGGDDEADQPLRRDCACRGTDAGFVHLSCLAGFAAAKSKKTTDDMNEFVNPWRVCPSCHQEYQNELRIDIATEFVSFVRRQYPDNTQRQVEALYLKLCALMKMFGKLQPVQKIELGVTANVLLSLIDRMKGDASSPLPRRYSHMEAFTYLTHGRLLSMREQKRVQGEQSFSLRST
jgi:E3 ubiquitin-protein ligase DOA10